MSKAAARKRALILVSEDYDPEEWTRVEGESEVQSWLAVAQDLWGVGCYAPGQREAAHTGAGGLTITKKQIVGAVGGALGGLAEVATGNGGAYIDVFDCNTEVLAHKRKDPAASKLLKLNGWNVESPSFADARYHSLIAVRAMSCCTAAEPLLKALAAAVKPGGQLFLEELHANDPSVGALVAQSISPPSQKLALHPTELAARTLQAEGLELRSTATVNEQLAAIIRAGLTRGQEIAQLLKTVPQPFRKQRLHAFAAELQRAAVLYQALDRGLLTAVQTIHRKPVAL